MNRELVLVGIAGGLVVVTLLAAVVLPGVVADPSDLEATPDRPGDIDITESTITEASVTGETATLDIDTYLQHRGGPVENVTVVHRVTNTETGLVADTAEDDVSPFENESERQVSGSITVPREGSYEVETIIYQNGTRTDTASRTVSGLEALEPAHLRTGVEITRMDGYDSMAEELPTIEYTVADVDNESVRLDVSTYLTNTGDDVEEGLTLELTARQADSNVVTDSTTVEVGTINPGNTARQSATLEVPSTYDYYLDATLWRGETALETDRAAANLGPGNLSVEDREAAQTFEVSDFETTGTTRGSDDRADADDGARADATPGFGVVAGLVAMFAGVVVAARRTRFDPLEVM